MELDWNFPHKVRQGDDGAYRWNYNMKENGNNAPFWTMIGICAAIGVPVALIMLVMTWPYGHLQAALSALGLVAMVVVLPALIWRLSPPDPSFELTDRTIEAWPKGKGRNLHSLDGVRQVTVRPGEDRVILRFAVTGVHVYIPPEDFDFVREAILACVPEGTPVLWE